MPRWRRLALHALGLRIGYGRVSTRDQHAEAQHDGLDAADCEQIFVDHASGKLVRWPEFDRALAAASRSTTSYSSPSSMGSAGRWNTPSTYPTISARLLTATRLWLNLPAVPIRDVRGGVPVVEFHGVAAARDTLFGDETFGCLSVPTDGGCRRGCVAMTRSPLPKLIRQACRACQRRPSISSEDSGQGIDPESSVDPWTPRRWLTRVLES